MSVDFRHYAFRAFWRSSQPYFFRIFFIHSSFFLYFHINERGGRANDRVRDLFFFSCGCRLVSVQTIVSIVFFLIFVDLKFNTTYPKEAEAEVGSL